MYSTLEESLGALHTVKLFLQFFPEPVEDLVLDYRDLDLDLETCNSMEWNDSCRFFGCVIRDDRGLNLAVPWRNLQCLMERAQMYSIFEDDFASSIQHLHYRPSKNMIYIHWDARCLENAMEYRFDHGFGENPFRTLHYRALERAFVELYPVTNAFVHFEENDAGDIIEVARNKFEPNFEKVHPVHEEARRLVRAYDALQQKFPKG